MHACACVCVPIGSSCVGSTNLPICTCALCIPSQMGEGLNMKWVVLYTKPCPKESCQVSTRRTFIVELCQFWCNSM